MWRRKRDRDPVPQAEPEGLAEARQARQDTERELEQVRQQGGEVRRIAQAFRDLRERNHFAERFKDALGGSQ